MAGPSARQRRFRERRALIACTLCRKLKKKVGQCSQLCVDLESDILELSAGMRAGHNVSVAVPLAKYADT
jgi:hypothetical protein